MTIKNHTFRLRLIRFCCAVIITVVITGIIRLISNEFDYRNIKIEFSEVCFLVILGMFSASDLDRIKLEISEVKEKEKLLDWIDDYLRSHNGSKIYHSNTHIVYEVEKSKRMFTSKKRFEYYLATIQNEKTLIEGPFSKRPSFITN